MRVWLTESNKMEMVSQIMYHLEPDHYILTEHADGHMGDVGTDGFILMQSTGLADGKGTEVFEGDVVEVKESPSLIIIGTVEWSKGEWQVRDSKYGMLNHYVAPWLWSITVLGNKYENPELLCGGKHGIRRNSSDNGTC